jgi:enoyl-CoA hydratase/carnithine racemase
MTSLVSYRLEAGVATLTMDDGKVNALSSAMLAELNAALDRAQQDRAIVLLTGRAGVFSAGFDLPVLRGGGVAAADMLKSGFELSARLLAFPTPVVAACTGHALAMGAFLLMSADYRVGAQGAFKIGANEVAIGLTMPHYAVELCRLRLAPQYFHRAVVSAEVYSPEGALSAGFLDEFVAPSALPDAATRATARLATLNMPAFAATKLRTREPALQAMRQAIEKDDAAWRAR